jgi:hypothetical protein
MLYKRDVGQFLWQGETIYLTIDDNFCGGKDNFCDNLQTQSYKGKGKALGHIVGRLITLIYALLRKDYEVISHLAPGAAPPEPLLYDPEMHKKHRNGEYQAIRTRDRAQRIVQASNT